MRTHAVLLGATEYNAGKTIKMGVHNSIRRVGGEKFVQCMAVCGAERVLPRHGENFAAERVNLFIVRAFPCAVRQKIELHACAVYVTVVIHQHRFQSATVHAVTACKTRSITDPSFIKGRRSSARRNRKTDKK